MPQKHDKNVRRRYDSQEFLKKSWRGFGDTLRQFAQRYSKAGIVPDADQSVLTSNQSVPTSSMSTKQRTSSKKAATKKVAKKATKKVAKKTTKQSTKSAKKTVAKRVAKKTTAKRATGKALVCASDQECFWVNDGPVLKDLQELERALNDMSEKMFAYHVSKDRNDFADWVDSVLKDTETAAALRKTKKPHTARKVVVRQLKLYKLPQ